MNTGQTVFSQVTGHLSLREFHRCVDQFDGDRRVRSLTCLDQFLGMAFAQLTYRESLRDIEACLGAAPARLYHMGFRGKLSRNTLAVANQKRDWRIYERLGYSLIATAQKLYANEPLGLTLERTVYALDSTVIDLCLAMFPWAKFRRKKGGIKIHTLLNVSSNIPSFVFVTNAKLHDVNILDAMIFEPGSVYLMDRAYVDYQRLYRLHQSAAFFVSRPRRTFRYRRVYSHAVDPSTGIRSDHTVVPKNFYAAKDYPENLRRIRYVDPETQKKLRFITNNFTWPAKTVAQLYKARWRVELFFKWIKQHLRIKAFYGTSENAVKTQIWISISVFVLVAILKKRLNLSQSLYQILQVLSLTLFEKVPIQQLFTRTDAPNEQGPSCKPLPLFDF